MFGHLNNAVYLELFDTVLNAWMHARDRHRRERRAGARRRRRDQLPLLREVAFPEPVEVGVRVARLGPHQRGVRVRPVPAEHTTAIATHGEWVQVYIDRETRRPVPIPDAVRAHLEGAVARRPVLAGEPA